MKTWGKEIWETKSINQKGITVSGGVTGLLLGEKRYLNYLNKRKNSILTFLKKHNDIRNILEIGPGPDAINAIALINKGYNLDLVDCSPNTLKLAKEKIGDKGVGLFEQDMIDLDIPFMLKKYDLIICLGTFLHCPAHLAIKTMTNFKNLLKEGGFLIIDFPIKQEMTFKRWLWTGIYHLGVVIKKKFYITCEEYTVEEIIDILLRTEFKLVQRKDFWILQK